NTINKRVLTLLLALSTTACADNGEAPNVLLIIVDDLRIELSAYGETHMRTPNIASTAVNASFTQQ
ncbi:MAG: hypothetical protein OEN20_08520, partial [Gammaproteobacteria bacterium]|nr:hypothetical protein [Gammaproteobacteria bacterium]